MADDRFFKITRPLSLTDICRLTGAATAEGQDGVDMDAPVITGVASLGHAVPGQITFLASRKLAAQLMESRATACFVAGMPDSMPQGIVALIVASPEKAFAQVGQALYGGPVKAGIHKGARVDASADIGEGCCIEAGAVVGAGVAIGPDSHIMANAVIGDNVQIGRDCRIGRGASLAYSLIGDRVVIHDGVRIGDDGFGFVADPAGHLKIVQLGRVIVQDDVTIGSNSTIARGALDDTVIGAGTKIDNLVHVAHNCKIGRHCLIAGLSGISGSVTLGDYVVLGGQVGIADHVEVVSGVQVAAKSGIPSSIRESGIYGGYPARPIGEWRREVVTINQLARRSRKGGQKKKPDEKQG